MNARKKWRKWIIILIIIVIAAVVCVWLLGRGKAAAYDEETARTQDIVTYYTFSGNIEPKDISVVTASSANKVSSLSVEEGDLVEEEDLLLKTQSGAKYEADISGTVTDVHVEKGDVFPAGAELVRIADYANPVVPIKVDEYDLKALSAGMEVSVEVQALGRTLTGVISSIDQEATVSNNIAYYMAKVAVPQDGTLKMGLSCEVKVPKESALTATTITMNAVQFDDDQQPYVYCYNRGNEVVRQDIVLGVNNGSYVQVLDGIKSGETILIPKDSSMMFMPSMSRSK